MRYRLFIIVVTTGCLTIALSCKKRPAAQPPPTPPAAAASAPTQPLTTPPPSAARPRPVETPSPRQPTESELFSQLSLDELNRQGPLADVYFDFDRVVLTDESLASLQRNSAWLRKWTTTKIMIEGHADERGTNEYNLALGELRAVAARNYLADLGVPSGRITLVSKGEEAPFCQSHDEGCWRQNRRAHFIITGK